MRTRAIYERLSFDILAGLLQATEVCAMEAREVWKARGPTGSDAGGDGKAIRSGARRAQTHLVVQGPGPAKLAFVKKPGEAVSEHPPRYMSESAALAEETDADSNVALSNTMVADLREIPACIVVAVSVTQTASGRTLFLRRSRLQGRGHRVRHVLPYGFDWRLRAHRSWPSGSGSV